MVDLVPDVDDAIRGRPVGIRPAGRPVGVFYRGKVQAGCLGGGAGEPVPVENQPGMIIFRFPVMLFDNVE